MPAKKLYTKEYLSSLHENITILQDIFGVHTKIESICKFHGKFITTPLKLTQLSNGGCEQCANNYSHTEKNKKLYTKEYLNSLHENIKYNGIDVIGRSTKIKLICSKHGTFETSVKLLINKKYPCKHCLNESHTKPKKLYTKEYLSSLHENITVLNNVRGIHNSVNLYCNIHKEQSFSNFNSFKNSKTGCPKCCSKDAKKLYTKEYLSSLFENITVKEDVVGSLTKFKAYCSNHGEFETYAKSFIQLTYGCNKCGYEQSTVKNSKLYTKEYLNSLHENITVKEDVIGSKNEIKCNCSKHGDFMTTSEIIQRSSWGGCNACSVSSSKGEKELLDFIKTLYDGDIIENDREILQNGKELDIYLPELKLAFEYNGVYWHSAEKKPRSYHKNKTDQAEKVGIHLVHIYEDQWVNKQDVIKSRIRNLLKKNEIIIYGRKCNIKLVDNKTANFFLKQNHLQGSTSAKIRYGLFYKGGLVSLMTFGERRKVLNSTGKGGYELIRFVNKQNVTVIGAANKLFKQFLKDCKPKKVISYADRSWSNIDKNIYKTLGMTLDSISSVGYSYIDQNLNRKHRFNYRKDILVNKYGYDKSLTETQITQSMGLTQLFDSGNLKYVLELEY